MVLANVVATLDQSRRVSIGTAQSSDILIEEIRDETQSRILPATADLIEIEATQIGADLVLAGAASGVLVDRLGVVLR